MEEILSVAQMRASDAATIASGISGRELMGRAGKAVFEAVSWKEPVAIVCGTGNNAGDGYVVAAHLQKAGIACTIWLVEEKFSVDGRSYYEEACSLGVPVRVWQGESLTSYATILDCLLGTGFHGVPEGKMADLIMTINQSTAYVVSVDINSGLHGDNGLGKCCVHSHQTVSIGSMQPGHLLADAKDVMQTVCNCPIGITTQGKPYYLWKKEDVRSLFPERKHRSNKSTYGYIALMGGSLKYAGAIRLAEMANAAMRAGAGVVQLATMHSLCPTLLPLILESTLYPLAEEGDTIAFDESALAALISRVRTTAFGMGAGMSKGVEETVRYLVTHVRDTLILDADGLNALSHIGVSLLKEALGQVVLTPHLKEFSRLTGKTIGEIEENPIPLAMDFAQTYGITLLLKGPTTIITDGETVYLVDRGCPGMATAGSGDVLSGILAALCAAHPENILAATAGAAYINGFAGELAEQDSSAVTMTAGDTARHIERAVCAILQD